MTFGVVQHAHGTPGVVHLILYAAAAVLSFTLLEAALSRGFSERLPQHTTRVAAFGTGLNLVSVLGGVGAAIGLARAVGDPAAWPVCAFGATLVYLVLEAFETLVAERVAVARGYPEGQRVHD